MSNTSGITPVGMSILVLPEQVEEKTETGIIVATSFDLERQQLRQTDGIVVALGPLAFYDEETPRCKVGDRVVMIAYAGMIRKGKDGLDYRLIRDTEVIALLDKEETNE